MYTRQKVQAYRRSEVSAAVHPVKLIHMMYERVLTHLSRAEEAIAENDPRKRGESLGKAIALITELNASINSKDESEAAAFLRGLYGAILVELPKVSLNNDITVLQQAARYIGELKKVWEETAMRDSNFGGEQATTPRPSTEPMQTTPVSISI